ncbi:hypothetical protein ZYGM_004929 [Zygosaccharomyces mellis]|uniref:Charged multivesicular body protein 7 n=1 Tax=Zygosaccharomyces mellis TaxID=42258 RepID=A0A4C2DZF1_9SACH|nr:hypothetical protein ZYGM_004929 [Zygosaccharomyces mellis]
MELPSTRLGSLYKDFRPLKELNPDGYAANINTWKKYLKNRFLSHNCLFFSGSEILQELSNDVYGFPKSLDVVIDALVQEGYLISSDDFYGQKMYSREYPKLMQWIGLGKNRFFKSRRNEDGYYLKELKLIVKVNVESKFKTIVSRINDRIIKKATGITDLIMPFEEFFEKTGFYDIADTNDDQEILLFYMAHYTETILKGFNFIKITDPIKGTEDLTINDTRIADLKLAISGISKQIEKMQTEQTDYSKILAHSIRGGAPKDTQRKFLQARKIADRHVNRLLEYQNNLLEIKSQIEMSITNEILVTTLSDANETLKSVTKYSVSVDQVEDLLDELKDHREQNLEIGRMLSGTGEIVDERELDAELESLEEQTKVEESTSKVLDRLSQLKLGEVTEARPVGETPRKEEAKSKQLLREYD